MAGFDFIWWWIAHRGMDDWQVFAAALSAFWRGANPYLVGQGDTRFYNPVWTLVVLAPALIIPPEWIALALTLATLIITALLARHFKLTTWQTALLLTSPVLFWSLGYGNIDFLVFGGLLLPAPLALPVLAMKPQATFPVMLVLLLKAYDRGGLIGLLKVGAPLAVLIVWWLLAYGWHSPNASNIGNASLWPWGLLVGLPLLAAALYWRSIRIGLVAGAFCTPYLSFSSYLGVALIFPGIMWITGALHFLAVFKTNVY